jgi:hypothetical protein
VCQRGIGKAITRYLFYHKTFYVKKHRKRRKTVHEKCTEELYMDTS